MRSLLSRILWLAMAMTSLVPMAGRSAPIPLSEAAASVAKPLRRGTIVTAELVGDAPPQYAASGKLEPADTPPEKVIFEIGSISKVFTGVLLELAVLDKKVTLDTTLREVLGEKQAFADPAVAAITLRQLITHTSGLPRLPKNLNSEKDHANPYAHYDRAMLDVAVAEQKLEGKPPFDSSYSNFGVGLLGDILSRLYGESWEQLVRERITEPLGMTDTAVTLTDEQEKRFAPPYGGTKSKDARRWTFAALAGAGALRSTAADMVKFGEALLAPEKTPLKEALTLVQQSQTSDGEIGLAIMLNKIDGHEVHWHSGATAGYQALLQTVPATRTVRVVLTNNFSVEPAAVVNAARNEKARLTDSGKVLTPEQLSAYEGVYPIGGKARFTIVRRDGRLWTQLTGQGFLPLFPHEQEDRFFLKVVAAEVQFHRENGKVVSMTNHQNGREFNANKSADTPPPVIFRSAKELAAFAGKYELGPKMTFTVKPADELLFVQLSGQPFAPVIERRENWFEYDVVEAAIEFERDEAGKVIALKLHQNGLIQRAVKKG
jgi:CubicO group peptidase (beta-lactamase class C family)